MGVKSPLPLTSSHHGRGTSVPSAGFKKLLHQLPALRLPDPARHFQAVVEAGILGQAVERHAGAALGVRGAEHQPPHPGRSIAPRHMMQGSMVT